jgi:hypothetical protein
VDAPPGAVGEPIILVYSTMDFAGGSVADMVYAGSSFRLDALVDGQPVEHMAFAKPLRLTVTYNPALAANVDVARMAIFVQDNGRWIDAAATCTPPSQYTRDPAAHTIQVDICHLSEYALFAGGSRVYLPEIGGR